ncbi:MAG: NAD+ synthetase [Lunatimonas sp.]|uniref:nitrilase-related carbon-nitrogen hydrolase n=1 Tax=Lunatimonas sp. TaxID=2060141 RepID=UPI00263B18D8|nr:nitrilase-related carbon-nitrogen hydrolase [Lunatimonas sp.]MCC5936261.1 NAD+ synthetase [Lunatimonas sp.]
MASIKLGGATVNQTPLDWEGNLGNLVSAIREANEHQVRLLCLPELSITGYGSEDLFLSYWYPKKALSSLRKLLPYTKGITVCVGLPVRVGQQVYNCVAIVEDQQLMGFVAKQFLAIDGVHYEYRWFTPWKAGEVITFDFFGEEVPLGDLVFTVDGFKVGLEICEDAWRGDQRPGFRLKDRKVDIILNPSASHFAMGKSRQRETLVKESSQALDVIYFYVNLLGNESGRMIFDGEVLLAQNGKLLMKNELLSFSSHQLLTYRIEKGQMPNGGLKPAHHKNEEFTRAAALALFDYLRKSRSGGFVLSLSGGADSSSIAVLVAEMVRRGVAELGMERFLQKLRLGAPLNANSSIREVVSVLFTVAYQGTENSSEATLASARMLAESIGAVFHQWSISEEVASYTRKIEHALGRKLTWEADDLALQNIQARARSPIIWMLANIKNALLLTTSNRSEGDVGYATMDGDTSGSISPIAAVDKHFILQWLQWAEKDLGYEGLMGVNGLQPSAELRPLENKQTDEDDLMPYAVIVAIERLAIRDRRSPLDVYLILSEELELDSALLKSYVAKFFRLWSRNQWKRERLAPSFHLDEFNVDPKTWYRFPILSGGYEEELKELDGLD